MKDFYNISDFYNSLKNPERVPTAHRHFQVYLYPIYFYGEQIITNGLIGGTNSNETIGNNFYNRRYGMNRGISALKEYGVVNGNGFFSDWFTEDTIEQFSLAIQKITFPTKFSTPTQEFVSPFGKYNGVDNNQFYGKLSDTSITFQLIDQMQPFFQKKINDWIFTVNRCSIPNQRGTLFPKVNIAIKYFRQDKVWRGNTNLIPNFIYYFTDAFPIEFTTCTIDHSGNDGEGDYRRSLVFRFNTMYPLQNEAYAQRFGLQYLFGPATVD